MKTIKRYSALLALFLVPIVVSGDRQFEAAWGSKVGPEWQMVTIAGLSSPCCRCYLAVCLRKVEGVRSVQENGEEGRLEVIINPSRITPGEILELARKLGFKIDFKKEQPQEEKSNKDKENTEEKIIDGLFV